MDPDPSETGRPLTVSDYNRRKAKHFTECYLSRSDASMSSARGSSGEESDGYEDDVIEDADIDALAPAVFGVNLGATLRHPSPVERPNETFEIPVPVSVPENEIHPTELGSAPVLLTGFTLPDSMPHYPLLSDYAPTRPSSSDAQQSSPPSGGFFSWVGSFLGFGPVNRVKSPEPIPTPTDSGSSTSTLSQPTSNLVPPNGTTTDSPKPTVALQSPSTKQTTSASTSTSPIATAPQPQNNYYFIFSGNNADPGAIPPQVKALMDNALSATGAPSTPSPSPNQTPYQPQSQLSSPQHQTQSGNPTPLASNSSSSSNSSSTSPTTTTAPLSPPKQSFDAPPPPPPPSASLSPDDEDSAFANSASNSAPPAPPAPPAPSLPPNALSPPPPPTSQGSAAPPPPSGMALPSVPSTGASSSGISIRQEAVSAEARAQRAREKRAVEEAKRARTNWIQEMTTLVNMCQTLKDEGKREAIKYWTDWYSDNIPHANLLTSAYFMFLRKIPKQFDLIASAIAFWEASLFEQLSQDPIFESSNVAVLRTRRAPYLCEMEEKWFRNKEITPDQVNEERIKLVDASFQFIEDLVRQEKQAEEKKALQEELGNTLKKRRDQVDVEEVIEYDE